MSLVQSVYILPFLPKNMKQKHKDKKLMKCIVPGSDWHALIKVVYNDKDGSRKMKQGDFHHLPSRVQYVRGEDCSFLHLFVVRSG